MLRKRKDRGEATRIYIPPCKDPQRRERALDDPELFLRGTYFKRQYYRPFGKLHYSIIDAFLEVMENGGKKAVAAPRGRGKTEITKGMLCYGICKGKIRFPIPIAQTTRDAYKIYKDFRKKVMVNELLCEDFPEICVPVRDLEGAPQRAWKQHIDGIPTNIEWTVEALKLADVPAKYRGEIDYSRVRMEYRGLDAAIRGVNSEADRPDFVIIDDPETRESAKSTTQIEDRERAIEQDIDPLAGEDQTLGQVMITTVQNRYCLSYKYTDPQQKPSWMGERFGWVVKWPDEWTDTDGLWHRYIELRKNGQIDGDRYGREATELYLDNRQRMESGGELLADNYKAIVLKDGWVTVHSAWQVVFNTIADTSYEAFCTEYQNDPPEAEGPQGLGLTAEIVANRLSGLDRRQLPANTTTLTAAIDLGKEYCHWVVCAWWKGAGGCVVDYGVAEVRGTDGLDEAASEPHIYRALVNWRDQILQTKWVDASGAERKLDTVFVDSGDYTNAAYEFVRQVGPPFYAIKGVGNYRSKKPSQSGDVLPGDHMDATFQKSENLWLFNLSVDYWKNWVHERFLTPTFDETNMLRHGSLSLFNPLGRQKHTSYAHHIVAEELVQEFVEGKGAKVYWHAHNRNNHWLDATTYAAAAARHKPGTRGFGEGVSLLHGSEVANTPTEKTEAVDRRKSQVRQKRPKHGPNLNRRNGWMQSIRRR